MIDAVSSTVSTPLKRAWLDDAYDAAVAASITLRAQLRAWESTARTAVSTGQIVASTSAGNSAGNRAVAFSIPNIDGLSPVTLVELVRELIDLNDYVVSDLELTDNTTNREAIKNEMMGLLVPCREAYNDFTLLRTGFQGVES
jgi:hypothetical protein